MYPKPSEILADFGIDLPPLAAGILDGAADASPLGMAGFVYDLTTDGQFRSDMVDAFAAIANDPVGAMEVMFEEYAGTMERLLAGEGTDEDYYMLGEEIGGAAVGLLTGGAIAKYGKKFLKMGKPKGKVASKVDDIPTVSQNRINGNAASDNIASRYPGARREVSRSTSDGTRYIDVLTSDGTAIESKVGRTSLSKSVKRQIDKDLELLNDPNSGVNALQWEFSKSPTTGKGGPTAPLKEYLESNGIEVIIND